MLIARQMLCADFDCTHSANHRTILLSFVVIFFTVTLNKCVLFAVSLMVFATSAKFPTSLHASNRRW